MGRIVACWGRNVVFWQGKCYLGDQTSSVLLGEKRYFVGERVTFPVEKGYCWGDDVVFWGEKQYSLGGNVMFLGENWYLGVKLVVGRESPVVGGKQAG
ncbi:Uncharacterised protein [Chlamydia abortus]|mgnify:CR=1 FL=1|nr:Uncharacterised protein [Chlamydia abortus]